METISSPSQGCVSETDDFTSPANAARCLAAMDDALARWAFLTRALSHFSADDFLPALMDEAERQFTIDPAVALLLAELLVSAGQEIGRPDHHAFGVMTRGNVYREMGRSAESVVAMDEAGALFLAHGNEVGWARTRVGWLISRHRLGYGEEAIAVADRARAIFVRHENWFRVASLDLNIGFVCYELGRYDQARVQYDRVLSVCASLGAEGDIRAAWAKANKAILLTQLGDFREALRLHEETRSVHAQHGFTVTLVRTEHNIAFVYAAQGHYTQALHRYGAVLAAYERAGIETNAGDVALNMVECYLNLNRPTEALELAEETVARFERIGTRTGAAKARFLSALAHARLGNTPHALALLDATAAAFATVGLALECALVTLQRALMLCDDAHWIAACAEAERAHAVFAARGLAVRGAQADLVCARAALGLGEYEAATRLAHSVLQVSADREVTWFAHEAHHILGRVAQARGAHEDALGAYGRAVTSIEQLQSTFATELRTHFLADKVRVYEDAITMSLRLARPELAFAYLERAKSRALVDYLAGNLDVQVRAREDADPALLDTLARLREEHNGLYNRLYGYGMAVREESGTQTGQASDTETLQAAIREREKQIARLLERLALDRTEGLRPDTADGAAHTALPALDAGTALLEYFFRSGDESGAVFVVTPGGLAVVPLAARPRDIQRLLRQWHLNLAATAQAMATNAPLDGLERNARGILGALYQLLIAPVAQQIAGCARVVVVPHGPTHTVPFHALYDGARYLLETAEVSYCPSSRLLELCAAQPRHPEPRALVVAHTDGGRLPAVRDEARAVAALLPGVCYTDDDATRASVIAAAPQHSVLHFASHGEARLDNPAFAHLKLADGHLTTTDVFNLQLRGALVTLSACETGRSVVAGGDELIGLSRGFLYAGASTLVQSLWRVEDDSTARLMTAFYRALSAGRPKGAALCEAQRSFLADRTAVGTHPYFWAPFQLIGDHGPL